MNDPRLSFRTSNRLEVLIEHLAVTLAGDPLPPLEREVVVVDSRAMARWLTLRLAERLGLAASLALPFPGSFLNDLAGGLLAAGGVAAAAGPQARSAFEREPLTWRIFERLGSGERAIAGLDVPRAYLEDDPDQVKRYQLSQRLAELYADYMLLRPRMLLGWESAPATSPASGHAAWQARLWRSLAADASEDHLARRVSRLLEMLAAAEVAPEGLPRRLAVFGVSILPPVFLELAGALARFLPVTLYVLSPTYLYWGDVRSEREAARIRGRTETSSSAADQHLESGNALLAGLGRQGRDFFNLLQEADAGGTAWHELELVEPGDDSLLHALQSDVLHLVDRGGPEAPPRMLATGDDSLSIHACHSPRREMEVLRDQLLLAFERDPRLEPSDVLVLVPRIDEYSPYIEAVFGVEWEGTPRLPFAVADRPVTEERPLAETVLELLDLVASRVTPRAVFDLLDTPAIRRAFDIAAGEVQGLRRWAAESRIRWGMDGAQRAADFDLPGEEANTWRAGLDRLLMGYAAGDAPQLVAGVAPRAGATAGDAGLLGRLAAFAEALFHHLRRLRRPRPPGEWARDIGAALETLCEAEGESEESGLELVRDALEELARPGGKIRVTEPLSLEVVRAELRRRLAGESAGGFLTGRITFCAAKPMRAIPFRVIAFAGLSDGAFPRRDLRPSFDLTAARRRPGDRSLTDDDRQLFLETLLAARDRLILTYQGRSEKDNRRLEAAVVVNELLDYVDRAFEPSDGRPARDHLVVEHRLRPESAEYYGAGGDPRLFSYSRESFEASAGGGERAAEPFVSAAPGPQAGGGPDASLDVELVELVELWINPARHYCRKVLELHLELEHGDVEEAEPFGVDLLERYRIRQWLLERRLAAVASNADLELLRGRGELPLAGLGSAYYARLEREVESFLATLPPCEPREPVPFEIAGLGWRLHGRFDELTDAGILRFRCADLKPRDSVQAWVTHVARCCWEVGKPSGLPLATRVIGTDRGVRFGPLADASQLLDRLMAGYRRGLESPLPLFEHASCAYVEHERRRSRARSHASPEDAARRAFAGTRLPGDASDPYVALCFRDRDPLAEEGFARWAEALWTPLFDHAEEEKG